MLVMGTWSIAAHFQTPTSNPSFPPSRKQWGSLFCWNHVYSEHLCTNQTQYRVTLLRPWIAATHTAVYRVLAAVMFWQCGNVAPWSFGRWAVCFFLFFIFLKWNVLSPYLWCGVGSFEWICHRPQWRLWSGLWKGIHHGWTPNKVK